MAAINGSPSFGDQLRKWRRTRHVSQLRLAVDAGVSPRHLSFIETGRSQPSREMVLHLTEQLRLPLRERNAMLLAAGYAPVYEQRPLQAPEMQAVREAVQSVLDAQEPFPAIAVDGKWNVVMGNRGAQLLSAGVAPPLLSSPPNVYRVCLHPEGMRHRIRNFNEYAGNLVAQLRRDANLSGHPELHALLGEIENYPGIRELAAPRFLPGSVALPLRLESEIGEPVFVTTVATFGTPYDVTVSSWRSSRSFRLIPRLPNAFARTPPPSPEPRSSHGLTWKGSASGWPL